MLFRSICVQLPLSLLILVWPSLVWAQDPTAEHLPDAPAVPGDLSTERPVDIGEVVTVRGQILDFSFTQPETRILLSSDGLDWELLGPSAVELRRLGWDSQSLFEGELVLVKALRLPGEFAQAQLINLTRADGTQLLTGTGETESVRLAHIQSGTYALDQEYRDLEFSFSHLGFSDIDVEFERLQASVLWNADAPEASTIQMDIEASSLRSGITALDAALRSPALFDTLNHPRIRFHSTGVEITAWDEILISGLLEIRGTRNPVQLRAILNRAATNPRNGLETVGISLVGDILRSDWGLTAFPEQAGDRIRISFDGEFALSAHTPPQMDSATGPEEDIASGTSTADPGSPGSSNGAPGQ